MDKLKPCPFCGREATQPYLMLPRKQRKWGVMCKQCGCRVDRYEVREDAIDAWNRRTVTP